MSQKLDYLLSTIAVRERSRALYEQALAGKTNWKVNQHLLEPCADFVVQVILEKYPDLHIPFHSRWGHFNGGGVDRVKKFKHKIEDLNPLEQLKSKWDLAIVSVLLDAGAGMQWSFYDKESKLKVSKSEGLALASLELFLSGSLSGNSARRLQVNAQALRSVSLETLKKYFQVTEENPLVGLEGRLELLHSLGKTLTDGGRDRPGDLVEELIKKSSQSKTIYAQDVLKVLLKNLSGIWPGRSKFEGFNLGDTWSHPLLGKTESFESYIPFHKLSQWLTYSLLEPLQEYGLKILGLDEMTGLPEYRNGGLFIDTGVLEWRGSSSKSLQKDVFQASDLEMIEWRACTVILLDECAPLICQKLKKSSSELPLVKILEGGTWWAGRKKAASLRTDGGPPMQIKSDGTVF